MKGHSSRKKQGSSYDKIIKENLEVTLPVIIKDLLGLQIVVSEELPDDVQHTKERKPDSLKKVTDIAGNTYVLHVEFQLEDEKEMVYRMAEYKVMLMRRYRLPVQQYVIYLKDTPPSMPTSLATEHLRFDFRLIRISEISYKLFLKSGQPEVQMLGILANFGKDDEEGAIESIVDRMMAIPSPGDFARSRHFNQLRILAQLRSSIELYFEKVMQKVSTFFKEEKDFFYKRGEARGIAKGEIIAEERKSMVVVENLIVKLGLPDEQIVELADVDLAFVQKIRSGLNKK